MKEMERERECVKDREKACERYDIYIYIYIERERGRNI